MIYRRHPATWFALAILLAALALAGPSAAQHPPRARGPWALSLFGGVLERGSMTSAVFPTSPDGGAHMLGLGLSRRMASWWDGRLHLELEPMVCAHFGDDRSLEMGAVAFLRWSAFPWNHVAATTLALGEGASYVDTIPAYEGTSEQGVEKLLNLLVLELTIAPPGRPEWALLLRVHHRSRAWGLYARNGESNFFLLGIKYRF